MTTQSPAEEAACSYELYVALHRSHRQYPQIFTMGRCTAEGEFVALKNCRVVPAFIVIVFPVPKSGMARMDWEPSSTLG